MKGNIIFDAQVGNWTSMKNEKIDDSTSNLEVARILSSIHDSMDRKIWGFIGRELDGKKLNGIADEIVKVNGKDTAEQIAKSLSKINSPTTTKKMAIEGKKAKEVAKTYIARRVIDKLDLRIEFVESLKNDNKSTDEKIKIDKMEGKIMFDAQVDTWICVKKQKIEEDTENMDIARILASIHDSMHRKIWEFVGREIDLEEVDKIAYEITEAIFNKKKKRWELKGRKSEAKILDNLIKLNSEETMKKIKNIEKENERARIAKDYLTRKVLEILSFKLELDPKLAEKYMEEKAKLA